MLEKPMTVSLDEIELAVIVNLETLREVLTKLSINGRRWWIASDPADAVESGSLTIGHGDPGCSDRLNTLYYRVPILNVEVPIAGIKKLALLLDSSVVSSEQPGIYMENGRILEDYIADLESFFSPIKRALVEMLRAG